MRYRKNNTKIGTHACLHGDNKRRNKVSACHSLLKLRHWLSITLRINKIQTFSVAHKQGSTEASPAPPNSSIAGFFSSFRTQNESHFMKMLLEPMWFWHVLGSLLALIAICDHFTSVFTYSLSVSPARIKAHEDRVLSILFTIPRTWRSAWHRVSDERHRGSESWQSCTRDQDVMSIFSQGCFHGATLWKGFPQTNQAPQSLASLESGLCFQCILEAFLFLTQAGMEWHRIDNIRIIINIKMITN